ncbi:putative acyl-coenzyme A:6-aminopenicillanic acid acyl-transferase subfamily [Treponema primitia ZAS-2]|uniref:Putative acyl-coenzyme A:6-aminopenicillanic acid acyl-transferase subfamily n=1 Tax=Treponema primitia (strain ATCC BAA-887 / DSM 12427 / ZAS-2) TaxID=545694 RepID=F5YLG3_TREPZ|nr:C45 family peptidase [Treponema primitia]AEF83881.1 putative acyl-coenzyme A:6-aminopenicillanic acid acyl-transferase subfamily [Treponema primitia ZAS-2]
MPQVINLKGTHYEQGVQEGKLLAKEIQVNCDFVRKSLEEKKINKSKYADFLAQNAAFMKENQNDLYSEMEGIAKGSGISWQEILELNIPAYFMSSSFTQECSQLLVRGKATADGHTYIIKNRDLSWRLDQALIHREYPNGLKVTESSGMGTLTYPGAGINSYGLAASTTGSWPKSIKPDLSLASKTSIFINIRLILDQCKTAKEAVEYVKSSPRMNGINLLIADSNDAFAVEVTKDEIDVQAAGDDGILFRTNHYMSEKFSPLNDKNYASTFYRAERIKELTEKIAGKFRFQDLFKIMSDHENGINSICRHPQGDIKTSTISTTLVSIEDKEVWLTPGNPCEHIQQSSL